MPRPAAVRLLLFGAAGVAAFYLGFLRYSPAEAGRLVQKYGYFVVLGTFVWWLWAVGRSLADDIQSGVTAARSVLRSHAWAVVMITGLTMVAVLSVPYNYKVLYDELVLQSTASSMHYSREAAAVMRGHEVVGEFRTLDVYLDKRPLLYPLLVSLLHDFTGFRVCNAFLLNTLLMPGVLVLIYAAAARLGGRAGGMAALACFGASPLLAQNANGTGMEMLNLGMMLATLCLGMRYLDRPEEGRLAALVLGCVLLAQTRYESAIYAGPVALMVFEGWRRAGRVVLPVAALVAPLLFVPYALQNTYVSGTPALWELRENVTKRFGFGFLEGNLRAAADYFFVMTPDYLNTPLLSVLGLAALGWVAWCLWRDGAGKWRTAPAAPLAAFLFCTGAWMNLSMLMVYYWGQFTDPLVFRLALPVNVTLALALAWVVGVLPETLRGKIAAGAVWAALIVYLGWGTRATARFETINQIGTELAWEQEWMSRQPLKSRLIITNGTALNWLLEKQPTLGIQYARGCGVKIAAGLANGTFEEVLVFQYCRPTGPEGGFVVDPANVLPETFKLEPIAERLFGAKQLRVSRVVGIDVKAAAKQDRTILIDALHVATVGAPDATEAPAGTVSIKGAPRSSVPASGAPEAATGR